MKIKKIIKTLGPGFITGASDDDPSGIATYSQTGAQFGYNQLWVAPFSFPFMTIIQEMCGRVGIVTGKGLAGIIHQHYSRFTLSIAVLLLFIANTINIGANLGAMAASAQLILHLPFVVLLLSFTIVILLLEIFVSYKNYAKFLKYLTFSLFAYIITAFLIKPNWNLIAIKTLMPHFSWDRNYLMNIVALLGTTISPYLFFWQATEEVEEEVAKKKISAIGKGAPRFTRKDIQKMRFDTIVGMFFSNLIMWFIIITTASTLALHGITNIESANQAALALKPFTGDFAFILFALGIIGTGMLAVPILAGSASYAISEAFGWKEGLYRKFKHAKGFYSVIILAIIMGLFMNFTAIKPFKMLYYTATLNGIIAPPLMLIIMLISNNKKIMGRYTNSIFINTMGWLITCMMSIAALAFLVAIIKS